jgi:hypothetical protein
VEGATVAIAEIEIGLPGQEAHAGNGLNQRLRSLDLAGADDTVAESGLLCKRHRDIAERAFRNRALDANRPGSTLMATIRSSRVSRAR